MPAPKKKIKHMLKKKKCADGKDKQKNQMEMQKKESKTNNGDRKESG